MDLDLHNAGTSAYVAIAVTAAVNLFIFLAKIWTARRERARREDARVEVARIEADDRANERLYETMRHQLEEQHVTIEQMGVRLDQAAEDIAEMRLAEDACQRELRSARAQIAALQTRVHQLEQKS